MFRGLLLVLTAGLGHASGFDREFHKISGMMAAVYTPMKNGGMELDLTKIKPYVAHLASVNVTNAMLAGTNGESVSLTIPERKQLAEAWAKEAAGSGVNVYVHVGCESLLDTIELAKHAASVPGIAGIVTMPPVFFKPSLQSLLAYLEAVAAAAPNTPLWYYHIPIMTGVLQGQANSLLNLIEQSGKMPTFMGVKFTDYDLADFVACKQIAGGKYNLLFGRDEKGLSALLLGADGFVSSTVQYSHTLRDVVQKFAKGDLDGAEVAQAKNAELCSFFGVYGSAAKNVQKAVMRMTGVDVGPPRLPFVDLSESEYVTLEHRLTAGNYIDQPSESVRVV